MYKVSSVRNKFFDIFCFNVLMYCFYIILFIIDFYIFCKCNGFLVCIIGISDWVLVW